MGSFNVRAASDGAIIVAADEQLGLYPAAVCADLVSWAAREPARTFLAERHGAAWRELTYGGALARVRTLGAGLLNSGASREAPLAIVAENGIDHALISLAAMYVGIPVAPISVGYAARDASPARLRDMLAMLGPGLAFAGDAAIAARIAAAAEDVAIVTDVAQLTGDATLADERSRASMRIRSRRSCLRPARPAHPKGS